MLNSIFVIIGTLIGAGFASGKEIFTFFNIYGFFGFFGLLFSQFIIFIVIYKTLYIVLNFNISSYSDFIGKVFTNSNFFKTILCNIMNIFLLISFIIMVAGFSAFFSQEFNFSNTFGSTVICSMCFFTFLKNIDGIAKVNKFFVPFLICIILLLGYNNLENFAASIYHTPKGPFLCIISSILYSSYNLVILIPILISLKKYILNIKCAKIISIVSTLFIAIMSIIMFLLINHYFNYIQNIELPIIYISSKINGIFKYVCGAVVLGAIFTTAISSGYGFLNNLNIKSTKTYCFASFLLCLISIFLSKFGFTVLLNLLYPILGILRLCTSYFYSVFFKKNLKILCFIDINI